MKPQTRFLNKNIIFHSLGFEYARIALEKNIIEGRCTQRYWTDGLRRKEDHPLYEDSYWFKGFSCSRDFSFAKNWSSIIFVLDKDKISQSKKIIPYSWNYGRSNCLPDHKKEKEEFVILKKVESTLKLKENPEFQKELREALAYDDNSMEYQEYLKDLKNRANHCDVLQAKKPQGSITLSEILLGFYIVESQYNYDLSFFTKNPKFISFIKDRGV